MMKISLPSPRRGSHAYLQETQKSGLSHIRQLLPARLGLHLEIDAATRRSLELTHAMRLEAAKGRC